MAETGGPASPPRKPLGGRSRLTAMALDVAGGMAVNDISGAVGYRGLAGVVALAAVLAATDWIRRLDPRALVPRYAGRLLLGCAGVVAVIGAFGHGASAAWPTLIAATLTAAAILLAANLETGAWVLAEVIGAGTHAAVRPGASPGGGRCSL